MFLFFWNYKRPNQTIAEGAKEIDRFIFIFFPPENCAWAETKSKL